MITIIENCKSENKQAIYTDLPENQTLYHVVILNRCMLGRKDLQLHIHGCHVKDKNIKNPELKQLRIYL